MTEQLTLDLGRRAALGRTDFLISSGNEAAIRVIDKWPQWTVPFVIVCGQKSSGKSHLLNVWVSKANAHFISLDSLSEDELFHLQENFPGALAIDNIDKAIQAQGEEAEKHLFHIINLAREHGAYILAASRIAPTAMSLKISDLKSRVLSAQIVEMGPPDDALLLGVFIKLIHDRQLTVDPEVVPFIINRSDRSFESIISAVEKIDAASLKEKRRITLPFVKKILSL